MIPFATLWHYFRSRRLKFGNRQALEQYQQRQLTRFARRVLTRSPYFQPYAHLPISEWPLMDKATMMANFDRMNTAGLKRDELFECARQSEASRDFSPKIGRFSVGLSSGTSGQRGIFVVSPLEQQIWAGGMLAKMLPDGLFAGERVALFLRADNNLYQSVNNRWLSLAFFDLFADFSQQLPRLTAYSPSIIVAPAQVLRALALAQLKGEISLSPKLIISVAEVLEPQDKELLSQVFPRVGEVYQATEGFLAATCSHGALHLNEEFVHIEPNWLDENRFTPIITDFTRQTQPIVRYRLDDVLVRSQKPCLCGQHSMVIERIEGRNDDQVLLPGVDGKPRVIFADLCSRVLANSLPLQCDYRLLQTGAAQLQLLSDCSEEALMASRDALLAVFEQQNVDIASLSWSLEQQALLPDFEHKRRRIIRQRP